MKKRTKQLLSSLVAVIFLIPILISPVAAAPLAHDPLNYNLYHMEDVNQFYFLVTNPSNQAVKLNFPTEKEFDLVIKKGNRPVWRYSDTKKFSNKGNQENFLPGHAKFYKIDVPKLPSDNYTLEAFFTGGYSSRQVVAQIPLNWGSSTGWRPPSTKPGARELDYRLLQPNDQELMLVVENNSSRTVRLDFPSNKEFDIVVYNSAWQVVWQDSWNKWYPSRGKKENLAPGQSKVYQTTLPKLNRGSYQARGYFYGVKGNDAVASLRFSVNQWNSGGNWNDNPNWNLGSKLSFSSWFNGGNQPQIAFEVKNTTNKPVKISYPVSKAIEVVVKGDNGFTWRYSNNLGGLSTSEIAAGGASYSFVYLPSLPKGNYKADVFYPPYSTVRPASSTSFRI